MTLTNLAKPSFSPVRKPNPRWEVKNMSECEKARACVNGDEWKCAYEYECEAFPDCFDCAIRKSKDCDMCFYEM